MLKSLESAVPDSPVCPERGALLDEVRRLGAPLLEAPPFTLNGQHKSALFTKALRALSRLHAYSCPQYRHILHSEGVDLDTLGEAQLLPFLPTALFKRLKLCSVPEAEIFKTLTSSGTTSQLRSQIFLDKESAQLQQRALIRTVSSFIGPARLPLLILDCPGVLKNREKFAARTAGVLGFSLFGRERCFALDDDMQLQAEAVESFLSRHLGERVLLFGFTYMVWQYLVEALRRLGRTLPLERGILIHGGGWKSLRARAVDEQAFKAGVLERTGISEVHDYYGMAEQSGTVYVECEHGHLHVPEFAQIFIRNPHDFGLCGRGERGIVEVCSLLPRSYPGHCLLTEDEGVLLGEDDCPCGRLGRYFKICGRLPQSELRGCSDTYAATAP